MVVRRKEQSMTPSDRIRYITEIARRLSMNEWPVIDLTLKQFELPWAEQWNGDDPNGYVVEMVGQATDESLLSLANHLDYQESVTPQGESTFWKPEHCRLFISHVPQFKVEASDLAEECLSRYAITAFVAHEDIEPTKEWQNEIELALGSMDAIVALLTPEFNDSKWTDQEIGFAVGQGKLVIPVRCGLDPYGFIAKHQGIQGAGKTIPQIAADVFQTLLKHQVTQGRMAEALVAQFERSESYLGEKKYETARTSSSVYGRLASPNRSNA